MVQSSFLAKEHGIETIAAASLFPLNDPPHLTSQLNQACVKPKAKTQASSRSNTDQKAVGLGKGVVFHTSCS